MKLNHTSETVLPTYGEDIKRIYIEYFQKLVSYLMGRFGLDRAEAEYIVQGLFIQLWLNGWKQMGEGFTFPVLIRYARFRAIDHNRKTSKLVYVDEFVGAIEEDKTNEHVNGVLRVTEEAMLLFDQLRLSSREQIIVIIIRRILPLPYETETVYAAMTARERGDYLPCASDQIVKAQISRNLSDLRGKLREERQKAA